MAPEVNLEMDSQNVKSLHYIGNGLDELFVKGHIIISVTSIIYVYTPSDTIYTAQSTYILVDCL